MRALSLVLAAAVLAGAFACSPGGGGSGGGGASASAALPGSLRLVGFDRRALSPAASPRLWLLVERPAALPASAFSLGESADGVTFTPLGAAPASVLPAALEYELLPPSVARYYRVASPIPSNRVAVLPGAGAQAPAIAAPAPGAAGATTFIAAPPGGLAGGAAHLATVVALDGEAYGSVAAPRIDFTTAP